MMARTMNTIGVLCFCNGVIPFVGEEEADLVVVGTIHVGKEQAIWGGGACLCEVFTLMFLFLECLSVVLEMVDCLCLAHTVYLHNYTHVTKSCCEWLICLTRMLSAISSVFSNVWG